MSKNRLSLRIAKKEIGKIEGANLDEEFMASKTPEGRSLIVRLIQAEALKGVVISVSRSSTSTRLRSNDD